MCRYFQSGNSNLPPVYRVQRKRGGRNQSQVYPVAHVIRDTGQQHQAERVKHTRHYGDKRPVVGSDEFKS